MIQKLSAHQSSAPELPYHRPNDAWVEVPPGSTNESSSQTKQKPSLRSRRRMFTAACSAFTLGAILIICYSPFASDFFAPGPLSSHHSPLLASEGADRCAACHANADGSMASWISATLITGHQTGLTQSELCLKCHDQSMASDFSLNPHNVAPAVLAQRSNSNDPGSFDSRLIFHPPVNEQNQIACSVCHREHHGNRDMKQLTDAQCQTCHSNAFHSFEHGHPEFVDYGRQRRPRIAFDHASHETVHFPGKQEAFHCSQCHLDDDFQNVKKLAPYEQSCAACHDQQIINSGQQGLAILALPMIDTTAIEAANLTVGSWPLAATGDFDGEIPALMRVMLSADPRAHEIFKKVGPDFEFSDIDPTRRESVANAVELIWAIKRLLLELSQDGPHAVQNRLEQVLEFEITDQQMQQLISNLDQPVFGNAVQRWLPDLQQDLAQHHSVDPGSDAAGQRKLTPALAVSWRGSTAAAPNVAGASADPPPVALPIIRIPARHQQPSDEETKWSTNVFADPQQDPERLAVNPLKALFAERENPTTAEPAAALPAIIRPAEPVTGMIGEPLETASIEQETVDPAGVGQRDAATADLNQNPLSLPSGWFRNDQLFRVSYRPSGHADRCIQNWIELVSHATDADRRVETRRLFEKTIARNGIGLCRNCHTADQLPDRTFAVNWRAEFRDPSTRGFTRFAHGPHRLQPELQDCSHCHALDRKTRNADSFLSVDPSAWFSNFAPITKTDCANCHQKGRTGSGCTQCHNYHVGSKVIGRK